MWFFSYCTPYLAADNKGSKLQANLYFPCSMVLLLLFNWTWMAEILRFMDNLHICSELFIWFLFISFQFVFNGCERVVKQKANNTLSLFLCTYVVCVLKIAVENPALLWIYARTKQMSNWRKNFCVAGACMCASVRQFSCFSHLLFKLKLVYLLVCRILLCQVFVLFHVSHALCVCSHCQFRLPFRLKALKTIWLNLYT